MTVTHWLYPTNEAGAYWLEDPDTGERTPVSPDDFWQGIQQHPDRPDSWYLATAYHQIKEGDCVWLYATAPQQHVYAMGRVLGVYQDNREDWHTNLRWDIPMTESLMLDSIPYGQFRQRLPTVRRANNTTHAVLERRLAAESVALTDPNDNEPPASEDDARMRVVTAIVRRQGQPAFRNLLLRHYDRRCAVTGDAVQQVLEAAHVTPYLGPHSNVAVNGLLLRADVHTLFDLFLISVDEQGRVLVSAQLAGSPYAKLAGQELYRPRAAAGHPSKQRLAKHRREFAAREKA